MWRRHPVLSRDDIPRVVGADIASLRIFRWTIEPEGSSRVQQQDNVPLYSRSYPAGHPLANLCSPRPDHQGPPERRLGMEGLDIRCAGEPIVAMICLSGTPCREIGTHFQTFNLQSEFTSPFLDVKGFSC